MVGVCLKGHMLNRINFKFPQDLLYLQDVAARKSIVDLACCKIDGIFSYLASMVDGRNERITVPEDHK